MAQNINMEACVSLFIKIIINHLSSSISTRQIIFPHFIWSCSVGEEWKRGWEHTGVHTIYSSHIQYSKWFDTGRFKTHKHTRAHTLKTWRQFQIMFWQTGADTTLILCKSSTSLASVHTSFLQVSFQQFKVSHSCSICSLWVRRVDNSTWPKLDEMYL